MTEDKGWICLYRKFLEWEWYDYPTAKIIFLHCLLRANYTDLKWRDIVVKRGQFITSYEKLASANGLTVQQVRTAIEKLQSTNEIIYQSTSHYSVITVKNYSLYQNSNKQKPQSNNKPITTNNKYNKYNKERDNKLSLSLEEREILKKYLVGLNQKRKNKIEDIDAYIRKLIENGDCLTKLDKAKKKLKQQKAKENIPPSEKNDKSTPEEDKAGLKLLRETVQNIRKRG